MPVPPTTENTMLLKPTLHIEVIVKEQPSKPADVQELRDISKQWFNNCHATVKIGRDIILEGEQLVPKKHLLTRLLGAIDQAFLGCVDIKQLSPSPSPAAIYNIFRSCLNELIRSSIVNTTTTTAAAVQLTPTPPNPTTRDSFKPSRATPSHSPPTEKQEQEQEPWTLLPPSDLLLLPTLSFLQINLLDPSHSHTPGPGVWPLAQQKCANFSGRTLRRLPILGLAMYTWGAGASVTLEEAVAALEKAVGGGGGGDGAAG
ncbi:hypothetical protein B0A55_08289, partial [Friedmanniomyces simplex]